VLEVGVEEDELSWLRKSCVLALTLNVVVWTSASAVASVISYELVCVGELEIRKYKWDTQVENGTKALRRAIPTPSSGQTVCSTKGVPIILIIPSRFILKIRIEA
jgi:hypothetical protein